jgi:hypothetical protein
MGNKYTVPLATYENIEVNLDAFYIDIMVYAQLKIGTIENKINDRQYIIYPNGGKVKILGIDNVDFTGLGCYTQMYKILVDDIRNRGDFEKMYGRPYTVYMSTDVLQKYILNHSFTVI